jgi:hypothetical protein
MSLSNAGGVSAKAGFLFQDYAAALFVIQMLSDKSLLAVRCEVTDDIDLVFNDYDEYVQVKTTDGERKWTLTEVCTVTKSKKEIGKPKPGVSADSIVHKSIQCEAGGRPAKFRLISSRDVRKELEYLRVVPAKRSNSLARDALLLSISKKIGAYVGPSGKGVEQWIDRVFWDVIPSLETLELRARNEIHKAAMAQGVILEPERGDAIILNAILSCITKKSALSRAIFTADDKTYTRKDFIEWFNSEILIVGEDARKYQKVYFNGSGGKNPILLKFVDLTSPPTSFGMGISQGYEKGKYRYPYIAESIVECLPEILLRPSELADNTGQSVLGKIRLISERLKSETPELLGLIGRVLMHSALRFYAASQPISATLYFDTADNSFQQFENIHIVQAETGDELWLGISEFSEDGELNFAMKNIASKINLLISKDFGKQRKRILDVREGSYLLAHNIDELLNPSIPFDDNIDRFRFVVFLGYKTKHLKLEEDPKAPKNSDHVSEAQYHFNSMIKTLLSTDAFFAKMSFCIYLFPNPCISTLKQAVADQLDGTKYV